MHASQPVDQICKWLPGGAADARRYRDTTFFPATASADNSGTTRSAPAAFRRPRRRAWQYAAQHLAVQRQRQRQARAAQSGACLRTGTQSLPAALLEALRDALGSNQRPGRRRGRPCEANIHTAHTVHTWHMIHTCARAGRLRERERRQQLHLRWRLQRRH
eukprot:358988-Chlamydomonas_euryale.AAC.8